MDNTSKMLVFELLCHTIVKIILLNGAIGPHIVNLCWSCVSEISQAPNGLGRHDKTSICAGVRALMSHYC